MIFLLYGLVVLYMCLNDNILEEPKYRYRAETLARALMWPVVFIGACLDELPSISEKIDAAAYAKAYEKLLQDLDGKENLEETANIDDYWEDLT